MNPQEIIDWLLDGDVAIQYQVHRDLLNTARPDLRARISSEGWGARFLQLRRENGHWGRAYYQPKWISTHYTLLDLKHMSIAPDNAPIRATISQVVRDLKAPDGGILPIGAEKRSDVCVNGMFLNVASYFNTPEESLRSIIDCVMDEHMHDGGFNCNSNRQGAGHSSLHTTISVLEGFLEYCRSGYAYRRQEIERLTTLAQEFIRLHRLFRSDHTGEIIDKRFLMLSYPFRWRYDILRALDYLRDAGVSFDERLQDALDLLYKKRRKDGRWPVQARHPGQTHFEMEAVGQPSRWNTLRALRVLRHFEV